MSKIVCVRLTEKQLKWLLHKADMQDFASNSHGIRYCVQHVLDESEPDDSPFRGE